MVAIKYAPIAAACLALCAGVGASVLAQRQADQPVPDVGLTPAVDGALGSQPSSFKDQALSNRAEAAVPSNPPASAGILGNVPGTTNENRAVLALTPGTTIALNGVHLSITQLAGLPDFLTALIAAITALFNTTLPSAPLPVPVPAVPAPASGVTGTLSAAIAQSVATLGVLIGLLPTLLPSGSTVPASVAAPLAPVLTLLGPVLPSGTGVSPTDPVGSVTGLVAILTAFLPVLTSIVGLLSGVGL
ncbi:hypothetical protein V8D89_000664 [Ganoderma adspersum]